MQTCMFSTASHACLQQERQAITQYSYCKLGTSQLQKKPDLSSALIIFEFKAPCCIIKLWK